MNFDLLVEGPTDEALGRRLLAATGHTSGVCFGRRGCSFIQQKIQGYAQRPRYGSPLLAMVDFMDFEYDCPPSLAAGLLPNKPQLMILSVVVRELESWILADKQGIADFLHVSVALVPGNPETLPDPKQSLISLARRSRRSHIREAFVPEQGTSGVIGPGYVLELQKFVGHFWDFNNARTASPSLDRCLTRLQTINQQQ
jgi:hypothetical protein